MVRRRMLTTEEALAEAKRLIAAGRVVIANEAAKQGHRPSVHVKSYQRHKPKSHPYDERGVFVLQWSRPGYGFGEITLTAKDGRFVVDSEGMSDEFVLDVIAQALRERREL